MYTTHSLCDLVEVLEDTILFYDGAARSSMGRTRAQHEEKVLHYTAMRDEVRSWEELRMQVRSVPTGAGTNESASDDLPALMNRIYRMYRMQCADRAPARAGATGTAQVTDPPRPTSTPERRSDQVEPVALSH